MICPICGKEFAGDTERFCSLKCARISSDTEEIYKERPGERRQGKMSKISEINQRARELGMSYGNYVAMLKTEKEKKERERK